MGINTDEGLRELTDTERRAVEMFHREEPIELIKVETGLTRPQIAAAVGQARALAATPAPAPAAVAPPSPQRVPAYQPSPELAASASRVADRAQRMAAAATQVQSDIDDVQAWAIEDLLKWADQDGRTRARTLAARTRLGVKELRDLAGRGEKVREAESQIQTLSAQLAAAKEALRLAKGQKPPTTSAPKAKGQTAVIRAWAKANGYQVADLGIIPGTIIEAYHAAHPDETGT